MTGLKNAATPVRTVRKGSRRSKLNKRQLKLRQKLLSSVIWCALSVMEKYSNTKKMKWNSVMFVLSQLLINNAALASPTQSSFAEPVSSILNQILKCVQIKHMELVDEGGVEGRVTHEKYKKLTHFNKCLSHWLEVLCLQYHHNCQNRWDKGVVNSNLIKDWLIP